MDDGSMITSSEVPQPMFAMLSKYFSVRAGEHRPSGLCSDGTREQRPELLREQHESERSVAGLMVVIGFSIGAIQAHLV